MKLLARHLDRPTTRGQSMVEFALILPLLALLLVLTIDVGRVFFGWVAVTNATRIGANEAAKNPGPWADGGTDQRYYDRIIADLEAINCDADTNGDGVVDGSDLPSPTFSNRVDTADPHEFGDHVEVALTCDFSLITPLANALLGGGITVGAESTFSVIGATINGIPTPAEPPTSPCLPTERIVPNLIGMSVAAPSRQPILPRTRIPSPPRPRRLPRPPAAASPTTPL
jgi:Flp pilus assembly protein TadG